MQQMFDKITGLPTSSSSSSGFVCEQFVQNAWKRDFCSNCFKSRCEHTVSERKSNVNRDETVTIVTKSVLVSDSSRSLTKRNVSFNEQLVQVIGIGGDDDLDNDDDDVVEDDDYDGLRDATGLIEDVIDNDDGADLSLVKITRINTDMNAGRKDILSLGVTQTLTTDRRTAPLEIQIKPFGDDTCLPARDCSDPGRKKTISLNRNCAFVREKPMIYQAKNFKINYLTKSKRTLPPQLPLNTTATIVSPIKDPKVEMDEKYRCDEMIEILSTTSSNDNDYVIDDVHNKESNTINDVTQVPEPETDLEPNRRSVAASLIDQKSLTIPIPSKRKAPNPPTLESMDDSSSRIDTKHPNPNDPVSLPIDKKSLQAKTFGKVFLKRFLKIGKQEIMGGGEDLMIGDDESSGGGGSDDVSKPKPKPRLHIVHPFELNGLDVKVIKNIKESREEVPSPPPRKPQRHLRQPHRKSLESTVTIGSDESQQQVVETEQKIDTRTSSSSTSNSSQDEPVQGGSESESELYAQYSFCSSENETSGFVDDDDDADESGVQSEQRQQQQQHQLIDTSKNCLQISIQAALVDREKLRLGGDSGSCKRKAPSTPPPPVPQEKQQPQQQQSLAEQVEEYDKKPIPSPKQKLKPKLTIVHPFKLSGINVQVIINIEKNRQVPSPLPRKPPRLSRPQKPHESAHGASSESESELYAQYSLCSSENEISGSINDDDDDDDNDNDDDNDITRPTETQYESRITLDPINHHSNIYIMDNKCFVAYPNAEPTPLLETTPATNNNNKNN